MQIHRIRGRDLREALEKAGQLHGPQAVVLGHETVPGDGVTVAVADARRSQVVARVPARHASSPLDPGLRDVERVLRRSGSSDALVDETLAAVSRGDGQGAYALDVAAEALGGMFPFAPSPRARASRARGAGPCVIAFCGPHRAGKTTAAAKLAARLGKAGRRAALITLDGERPGALALLSGWAELLQVPADVARDAVELRGLIRRSRNFDAVLVDGSGKSATDVALLRELRAREPGVRLESYLLAPATAGRNVLDESAARHAPLAPSGLVVSMLDRTRRPAPVLEHSRESGIPLAFLCSGAEIVDRISRPSSDHVADLLLRGRMK